MIENIEKGMKLLINQYLSFITIIMIIGYIADLRLVFNHLGFFEIIIDLISIIFIASFSVYYIKNDRKYIFHSVYCSLLLYCIILTQCYVSIILFFFSFIMIGIIFYSLLEIIYGD
jgi:hypothetical protein